MRQSASFLAEYADRLKGVISDEAYYEISEAVRTYNEELAKNEGLTDEMISAMEQVNVVYKEYAKTMGTAVKALDVSNRGIRTFNDLLKQTQRYLTETVTSLTFWLQLFRKAGQVIKDGIASAADYAESINYLKVVTQEQNAALEQFIALQEAAFGVDPTQLRTTAAMFFQIGNSLSWNKEQALLLSKTYTQLAQDMASLHNVDLETATQKLVAGLTGQSKALKVWGIDVQDATIEEWLLTKGIDASMTTMNEATQTAARYAYILDRTSNAQGDLANTIESPANQFKILATQTKLLGQNLSAFAIPSIMVFVRLINSILQPVNAFLQAFTAASTENFTSSIGSGSEALTDLETDAENATKAMAGLTGIDEINQAEGGASIGKTFAEDASLIDGSIAELL